MVRCMLDDNSPENHTDSPEAFSLSWISFYRSGTDPGKREGPADDNGAFANKWICSSVVILQTQMRDQVFAHNVAQRVLQLHRLNEQIVLWIETFSRLR